MSESIKNENSFIAYEYKEVTVHRGIETLYADGYPSFGWKLDGTGLAMNLTSVNLKFKRDRRIQNKNELTKLQREFEAQAKNIEKLEDSKMIAPSVVAYSVGIVGTALMAGSVFAFLASMIPLCIILAIPAFIGWVVPYFAFLKVKQTKESKVTPIIDQQYDAIYELCEKANILLCD